MAYYPTNKLKDLNSIIKAIERKVRVFVTYDVVNLYNNLFIARIFKMC